MSGYTKAEGINMLRVINGNATMITREISLIVPALSRANIGDGDHRFCGLYNTANTSASIVRLLRILRESLEACDTQSTQYHSLKY